MEIELNPTDKHLVQSWELLDNLKLGEILVIADHAPNKPQLFIKCCKMYADCYGTLLFKSDYSEIKKVLSFNEEINV